jgi:hypothetical protein
MGLINTQDPGTQPRSLPSFTRFVVVAVVAVGNCLVSAAGTMDMMIAVLEMVYGRTSILLLNGEAVGDALLLGDPALGGQHAHGMLRGADA